MFDYTRWTISVGSIVVCTGLTNNIFSLEYYLCFENYSLYQPKRNIHILRDNRDRINLLDDNNKKINSFYHRHAWFSKICLPMYRVDLSGVTDSFLNVETHLSSAHLFLVRLWICNGERSFSIRRRSKKYSYTSQEHIN